MVGNQFSSLGDFIKCTKHIARKFTRAAVLKAARIILYKQPQCSLLGTKWLAQDRTGRVGALDRFNRVAEICEIMFLDTGPILAAVDDVLVFYEKTLNECTLQFTMSTYKRLPNNQCRCSAEFNVT